MAATTPGVSLGAERRSGDDHRDRAAARREAAAGAGGPGGHPPGKPSGGSSPRATTAPVIAGSLTLPGQTRNVAEARAFIAKTLGLQHPCCDTAVLLCSELVTNAVVHSASGLPGGTVTIVVLRLTGAVRVEVIDHGSTASTPVVKGEVLAPDGHGLFLVDQLADSWGYVLDQVGTTVWFRLTG